MFSITQPYPNFYDLDGDVLDNGLIYIGNVGTNPLISSNQVAVFWDNSGSQPAPQPLKTINGHIVRSGTPAQVYVYQQYSIAVYDKRNRLVYYSRDGQSDGTGSMSVGSMQDLLKVNPASLSSGFSYLVREYYPGSGYGGNVFFYDPTIQRSKHNGGSIIAPTVPWSETLRDFSNGTGNSDPSGYGCFVATGNSFTPAQFGAKTISTAGPLAFDSWPAVQSALDYLSGLPGGGALTYDGIYQSNYVHFVGNNTEIRGKGLGTGQYFLDPTLGRSGRGGFVFGAWHEADPAIGIPKGKAGTYTSPLNAAFVELPLGTYLRDNLSYTKCRGSTIHDIEIFPVFSTAGGNGGYAINFVNAVDCSAWNIWADRWTEVVNMGSDVAPTTPSCHNCHAWNIFVEEPDNIRCYYAIGFIANSTQCSIGASFAYNWSSDNQTDGVYIVASEDCFAYDLYLNAGDKTFVAGLGDTRGVTIQGGRRNRILNITAIGLHNAVAIEPDLNATNLPTSWDDKNEAIGITSSKCVFADIRATGPMYGEIRDIREVSGTQQIRYGASTSHFRIDLKRSWVVAASDGTMLQALTDISLGVRVARVIQPGLASFKAGTSITPAQIVGGIATPPQIYQDLPEFHTITNMAAFGAFGPGSQSAGAVANMYIYGQRTYNSSNTDAGQLVAQENDNRSPTTDATEAFSISKDIWKTILGAQPININNMLAVMNYNGNVQNNSTWKSFRITGWGYND